MKVLVCTCEGHCRLLSSLPCPPLMTASFTKSTVESLIICSQLHSFTVEIILWRSYGRRHTFSDKTTPSGNLIIASYTAIALVLHFHHGAFSCRGWGRLCSSLLSRYVCSQEIRSGIYFSHQLQSQFYYQQLVLTGMPFPGLSYILLLACLVLLRYVWPLTTV